MSAFAAALVLALIGMAAWFWATRGQYVTELSLDDFSLRTKRTAFPRLILASRRTYLTDFIDGRSDLSTSPGREDWVIVRGAVPGVRGLFSHGKHIVRWMNLDDGVGRFRTWSEQHPDDAAELIRRLQDAVGRSSPERVGDALRLTLFEHGGEDFKRLSGAIGSLDLVSNP